MSAVDHVMEQRRRQVSRRRMWRYGLEAAPWLAAAIAVGFFVDAGGLITGQPLDYLYSLGRISGILASVLVMTQVLLISRAPWVERAAGHDRTTRLHTTTGKIAFIAMLVHVGLITLMSAHYAGRDPREQVMAFADLGWYMSTAQVGFAVFTLVVATSLVIVRKRWRYEKWHAVHLMVYVAIALVVPHQFLYGTTFRSLDVAWWYWLTLYALAFGSLLVWRVARPLWRLWRHELTVASVDTLPDGSHTVVMRGRGLARWRAQAGQFFIWRFLDRERWHSAHPFSLSAEPTDTELRITAKPVGDFTRALGGLRVGTRVMADGPLGLFSHATRTRHGLVLLSAGIGVTPIRSMLESFDTEEPCTVILRYASEDQAPLLDEVRQLADRKGATLHVMFGTRQDRWVPGGHDAALTDLAPHVAQSDVYICGPVPWADMVEREAMAAGCVKQAIHREQFAW